jgi:hypothetical protein
MHLAMVIEIKEQKALKVTPSPSPIGSSIVTSLGSGYYDGLPSVWSWPLAVWAILGYLTDWLSVFRSMG